MTSLSIRGMNNSVRLAEHIDDARRKEDARSETRRNYWKQRLAIALDMLRAVDPNWEAWWDGDAVPQEASNRIFAGLVEARICQVTGRGWQIARCRLYRNVFIWTDDTGAYIIDEAGRWYEFSGEQEARAFVDAQIAQALTWTGSEWGAPIPLNGSISA